MAREATYERASAEDLAVGDEVRVTVNERASNHLGTDTFEAVVDATLGTDVRFRPENKLQATHDTHTWYADIGYIHGYHKGLGRHSDIGKVAKVERLE